MVVVLSFSASDEDAAGARQDAMMIAMLDGHGSCSSVLLVTLQIVTSAVAADLRSTTSRCGAGSL